MGFNAVIFYDDPIIDYHVFTAIIKFMAYTDMCTRVSMVEKAIQKRLPW